MKESVMTLFAIVLLLMAGSIGPLFPYLNIVSGTGFMIIGLKAATIYNKEI